MSTGPRTALVTGGNRGIGLEVCRQLAMRGVSVVLGARDRARGEQARRALAAEGWTVRMVRLDVTDARSVGAAARVLARAGVQVDVLVNNAGVYPAGTVLGAPWQAFDDALRTNLLGALRTCRAFVPAMVERGWGRVVNVSARYGLFSEGLKGPAPYSLSKAALNALTRKLADEVPASVKVNAVSPGWVRTRMGGAAAPRGVEQGAASVVRLATLGDDGPTGRMFYDDQPVDW